MVLSYLLENLVRSGEVGSGQVGAGLVGTCGVHSYFWRFGDIFVTPSPPSHKIFPLHTPYMVAGY